MRIQDEYGVSWVVESGDPARTLVNRLKRYGFDWVVLPRYTLVTGKIMDKAESPDFLRDVRMKDCVGRLSGA
jgi:hypothetical protein